MLFCKVQNKREKMQGKTNLLLDLVLLVFIPILILDQLFKTRLLVDEFLVIRSLFLHKSCYRRGGDGDLTWWCHFCCCVVVYFVKVVVEEGCWVARKRGVHRDRACCISDMEPKLYFDGSLPPLSILCFYHSFSKFHLFSIEMHIE